MWHPLLLALLLIHASRATLFSESGPQQVYYADTDDDYAARAANAYDPEQLVRVIEELNKVAELDSRRHRTAFDEDDVRMNAMDIDLAREVATEKPMTAQKKGQNEFVEFVEPKAANQLKTVESLEKRVPAQHGASRKSVLVHNGNLLFIAVATVCVVASVLGVVGGAYYFNVIRLNQVAAERSDFTHYAPAGPGKDKKKKRGDEGLAYKAQLHHYQQTKQKIISGEELGAGMPDNDETSEASDDEGNNFSVYECPGLAPTGDIEVQNPNFDSRP